MASLPSLDKIFANLLPKKQPKGVTSATATFNPQSKDVVLSLPAYREHITTLYDDRLNKSSKDLLQDLMKNDPDCSATVGAYLTLADTPLSMLVYDTKGQIDRTATETLMQLVQALTNPTDYSQGFVLKPNMEMFCQELRYMIMLRGVIGTELVFDKMLVPSRMQHVDMASIEWFEKEPGAYKPRQKVPGVSGGVMLDIPSFFVAFHRRDPTKIYANSDFVSVINTIAARQQVVNELYRIMQVTGFPRIALKVVEEVLMKSVPAGIASDPAQVASWANARLTEVADAFSDLRSDQAFAHMDSVEPSVINEKNPAAGVDVSKVIDVLNAQNQAGLKTMATVIGRGTGSTQVASAEVRVQAMNADQLNVPVKQILDQSLTFLLNSYGVPGFVRCKFAPAELRPNLELEPQKVLRQARMLQDLSLGIISDEEYHLTSYGRLPGARSEALSGTHFMDAATASVDTSAVSSNSAPGDLSKAMSPGGSVTPQTKSKSTPKVKAGINLTLSI